jgi:hypothetical protein
VGKRTCRCREISQGVVKIRTGRRDDHRGAPQCNRVVLPPEGGSHKF